MALSLLDRSRTREGQPDAAALRQTLRRAELAEAAGYHRFWVAEHHAVPGIASGAPPLLIGAIADRTSRIRV
ncbi:LLM class flavin-dependent oxidoreductase, partial [Rhodococcus sp. BUPNP1]